jgi:hypothetical protein
VAVKERGGGAAQVVVTAKELKTPPTNDTVRVGLKAALGKPAKLIVKALGTPGARLLSTGKEGVWVAPLGRLVTVKVSTVTLAVLELGLVTVTTIEVS